MRNLRTFAALLLAFGSLLIAQPAHAAFAEANIVCQSPDGESQESYLVGWDNEQEFFDGKGYIPALFCEGGYSMYGEGATYVSDDLADSSLGWYAGIVTSEPEPEPTPTETPLPTEEPTMEPAPEETVSPEPQPEEPVEPTPTESPTSSPEPTEEPTESPSEPALPSGDIQVYEGQELTITAPEGYVISGVVAWYGDPNDASCGVDVSQLIASLAIGQTQVTLVSNNSEFGDSCPGVLKVLFVTLSFELQSADSASESPTVSPSPEPSPTDSAVTESPVSESPTVSPEPEVTPSPEESPSPEPTPEPTPVQPVVPPTVEPSPEPSPSSTPEPEVVVPEPAPSPEPPIVSEPEPTPEPEPSPTPETTEPPLVEEEPTPAPESEPTTTPAPVPTKENEPQPTPSPEVSPEPEEPAPTPSPSPEQSPEPKPNPAPEPNQPTLQEVTSDTPIADIATVLENVVPTSLTEEQAAVLVSVALATFETAEPGSEEYEQALDLLLVAAQQDDVVLDETLAAIPLIGDVAGAAVEVFNALGNAGADMSPQVREQSEKVVVASVIVANIAITATAAATSAASVAARRP